MYVKGQIGCESWTIKKAEHQRIDTFELWCWRRLLRVPWTARRFNLSIVNPLRLLFIIFKLVLLINVLYSAVFLKGKMLF